MTEKEKKVAAVEQLAVMGGCRQDDDGPYRGKWTDFPEDQIVVMLCAQHTEGFPKMEGVRPLDVARLCLQGPMPNLCPLRVLPLPVLGRYLLEFSEELSPGEMAALCSKVT